MNVDLWADGWFVPLLEFGWGIAIIIWPGYMMNLKSRFRRELKDPQFGARFRAVLERRAGIEVVSKVPWRIGGVVSILLGVLTSAGMLSPIVSYALLYLNLGIVTVTALLRLRNQGNRRVASLAPRAPSQSVPNWVYVVACVDGLTPLALLSVPTLAFAAAIVSLVSVLLIAGSFIANGMAAMLAGQDTEIEMVVEERIRLLRVGGLVLLAVLMALAFFSMAIPGLPPSLRPGPVLLGDLLNSLIGLLICIWFSGHALRKVKPHDGVHVL